MPPRQSKKAASSPLPLSNTCIAFQGALGRTHKDLADIVVALGGRNSPDVGTHCTHLIVSEKDAAKKHGQKLSLALKFGVKMVLVTWLEECQRLHALQPEEKYLAKIPGCGDEDTDNTIAKKEDGAAASIKKENQDAENTDIKIEDGAVAPVKRKRGTPAAPAITTTTPGDSDNEDKKPAKRPRGKKDSVEPKDEPAATVPGAVLPSDQTNEKPANTVPIDPQCTLSSYNVYIDPDTGVVYDASLNQTNSGHNNNKYYLIQLIKSPCGKKFQTWTRWGRVGESGQSKMLGDGSLVSALKDFNKKFKDKSGLKWENREDEPKKGKYVYIERSYESDDEEDDGAANEAAAVEEDVKEEEVSMPESLLHPQVQNLMTFIFDPLLFQNTFRALNYNANKLPLGKLGKQTILHGFETLKRLADILGSAIQPASAVLDLSNRYYSYIPHDFGRHNPPLINNMEMVKKEVALLESLSDMKAASDIIKSCSKVQKGDVPTVHPLDQKFAALGLDEMEPLDHRSKEYTLLEEYLIGSQGSTHSNLKYKVLDIFRITRATEPDRFATPDKFGEILKDAKKEQLPASNRRLLWHGSRASNFGGILSQGLRIAPPEAPVSGYMFGKGVYLADMSSKSANYCCSYNSDNTGLLLLCEAELGTPMHELRDSCYEANEQAYAKSKLSTLGKGRVDPTKWIDAGVVNPDLAGVQMPDTSEKPTEAEDRYLQYNEYICYDVSQVRLRYLFRVKM